MAVSVGELRLDITANGAAAVEQALGRIDRTARDLGSRPVRLNLNAEAGRQLRNLGDESERALKSIQNLAMGNLSAITQRVALLADGMRMASTRAGSLDVLRRTESALQAQLRATNLTLEQRIALERQLRTTQAAARGGTLMGRAQNFLTTSPVGQGLAGAIGGIGIAAGVTAGITALTNTVSGAITASANLTTSLRVLDATSRITGTPLSFLTRTAGELQRSLGLTATTANNLTAGATRVTAAAGRTVDTGRFLTAWLDLAASRGKTAAEAMSLLQSNILENDEAVNALGLSNPSVIYEKWAASAGTTAAKMTDTQKAAAIVNEVIDTGSKVTGEFASRMNSAAGSVERYNQAKETFLVALGQAITGGTGYTTIVGAMTGAFEGLTAFVRENRNEIQALVGALGTVVTVAGRVIGMLSTVARFSQAGLMGGLTGMLLGRRGGAAAGAGAAEDPLAERAEMAGLQAEARAMAAGAAPPRVGAVAGRRPGGMRPNGPRELAPTNISRVNTAGLGGVGMTAAAGGLTATAPLMDLQVRLRPLVINVPEATRQLQERVATFSRSVGETVASSITAGFGAAFTRAFQGGGVLSAIGDGFKALTGSLLGGLGAAMVQFGQQALLASKLMAAIKLALGKLSPLAGAAAAIALIAAGQLLQTGAAAAFGGRGGGRGAGGGGFAGGGSGGGGSAPLPFTIGSTRAQQPAATVPAPSGYTPQNARNVTVNVTSIGTLTPVQQRELMTNIRDAERRGL